MSSTPSSPLGRSFTRNLDTLYQLPRSKGAAANSSYSYVIGQVPSNLALYYLPGRLFLPGMMLVWGALTMLTAATHNPQGVMAIRFFLGMAEASTFAGTHYILGAWYTQRELGKRSGIFTASGLAGTMFGGFIQAGINESLNGAAGLPGWRWLYIVRTRILY